MARGSRPTSGRPTSSNRSAAEPMDKAPASEDDDSNSNNGDFAPPPLELRNFVQSSSDEETSEEEEAGSGEISDMEHAQDENDDNSDDSSNDDGPPPLMDGRQEGVSDSSDYQSDDDDDDDDDSVAPAAAASVSSRGAASAAQEGEDSDSDSAEDSAASQGSDNLPTLVPREILDSSDNHSSDNAGCGRRSRRKTRRKARRRRRQQAISEYANGGPPPLLNPSSSDDSSSSDDDDDGDDDSAVDDRLDIEEKTLEPRPVFHKGDYVVYQLEVQGVSSVALESDELGVAESKNITAASSKKHVWTQGRIFRVEDKATKIKGKNKKKRSSKSGSKGGVVKKVYHIQPLDAKKGELVKVVDLHTSWIALDPTGGAILNYEEGCKVLALVQEGDHPGLHAKAMGQQAKKPLFWAEAKVERVWPGDINPPCPYQVRFLETPDLPPLYFEQEDPSKLQLMDKVYRFSHHENVTCRVGPGQFKTGLVFETHVHVDESMRTADANKAVNMHREVSDIATYRCIISGENNEPNINNFIVYEDTLCDIRPDPKLDEGGACQEARDLLLLGIEQDCVVPFFRDLVEECSADVLVRQDCPGYWIARAVEAGSYNALLWFEEDLGINLDIYHLRQNPVLARRGRSLLHCLADSPHALRFFSKWAGKSQRYHKEKGDKTAEKGIRLLLDCLRYDPSMPMEVPRTMSLLDENGQTFLHALASHGDIRSLDILIARPRMGAKQPKQQRLWDLVHVVNEHNDPIVAWKDDSGRTAADLARSLGHFRMAQLLEEDFSAFSYVHVLSQTLRSRASPTVEILECIRGKYDRLRKGVVILKDMQAMHELYGSDHFVSVEAASAAAAQRGNLPVLKWLYDQLPPAIPLESFFVDYTCQVETTADLGEFTCRHGFGVTEIDQKGAEALSIMSCAVHGGSVLRPLLGEEDFEVFQSTMERDYWKYILQVTEDEEAGTAYATDNERVWNGDPNLSLPDPLADLISFLRGKDCSTYVGSMLKRYKLCLIQDDHDLEERLETLKWIVLDRSQKAPSVVDVIRWRQCGVLRWLVDQGLVKLDVPAGQLCELSAFVNSDTTQPAWLKDKAAGKAALQSLTVGQMLCFLSVQFDDIQVLDWLVKDRAIDPKVAYQGWNLLHVSALFCKKEIAAYLIWRNYLPVDDKRADSRFGDGNYCAHIALEAGDLLLSQFLIKKGCPRVDSLGRSVLWYGERSNHQEVRNWWERTSRRATFEGNISSLCGMLFVGKKARKHIDWDKIKTFAIDSKCLRDKEWLQGGYEAADKPCGGKSFWDIVDRIAETADSDFVKYFYDEVVPDCYYDLTAHEPEACKMRGFWKRVDANRNDLDGKEMEKKILDRLKKQDSSNFLILKKMSSKMLSYRSSGEQNFRSDLAAPIDPLFKRIKGKLIRRRDTKSISWFVQKEEQLLSQQLLTDLTSFSAKLIEHHIQEGSSEEDLEACFVALTSSAALLRKLNRSHPILQTNSKTIGSCPFVPRGKGEINQLYGASDNVNLAKFAIRHGYGCNAFGLATCMGQLSVLQWLIKRFPDSWTDEQLLQMIRLAAFSEKGDVVDWLLREDSTGNRATRGERNLAALLGAAEAGRLLYLQRFFPGAKEKLLDLASDDSPVASAVTGLYSQLDEEGNAGEGVATQFFDCIEWIGAQLECRRFDGAIVAVNECTTERFKYLNKIFKLLTPTDIWENRHDLSLMCRDFDVKLEPRDIDCFLSMLSLLSEGGVDIQPIVSISSVDVKVDNFNKKLEKLQEEQRIRWAPFHSLSFGENAASIQLVDVYNPEGLKMAHCAAACGRVDVLDLLERKFPAQFDQLDKSGRSVEEIAKANVSPDLLRWVQQRAAGARLSTLLSAVYRTVQAVQEKKLKLERLRHLQGACRGYLTRKLYRPRVLARLLQRKRYIFFWSRLKTVCSDLKGTTNSWDSTKAGYNLARNIENLRENMEEYGETFKLLDEAGEEAFYGSDDEEQGVKAAAHTNVSRTTRETPTDEEMKEDDAVLIEGSSKEGDSGELEDEDEDLLVPLPGELQDTDFDRPLPPMDNIKLTKEVLKWIRTTEGKYVDLFIRRIEQLAAGQRSRILQKNLVGSATTIYETYLEQKKAQRIMWTPCVDGGKHSILIWYVAKHKEVSHLMELIDQAQKRSSTTFISAKTLYEYEDVSEDILMIKPEEIFLDPIRDVPLKLHQVPTGDIQKLKSASWVPPLRLTPEERYCVEKDGTVLLLGRSGTGKTLCIANRIVLESESNTANPSFKQLFVARNKKICNLVETLVGADNSGKCKFFSFSKFLDRCGDIVGETKEQRSKRYQVGYQRYRREFYRETKDTALDPLVIWTQIRTFIKGSIEAVQKGRPLEREEYMQLGEKNCRLTMAQKECAYGAFESYNKQLSTRGLSDDSDRIFNLFESLKTLDLETLERLSFNRLYVDEIQDYTQAQLALFFTLCKDRSLFLAGDNAQSVEEGVDFRFQDLRAVAHALYNGDRRYIPEKPLSVNKNFRSHAGILNVAGAVLERLFSAFPASANKLPPDEGIFLGPRPGVFNVVEMDGLKSLLKRNPKLHVLMHDDKKEALKESLGVGCKNALIGIRASKGLEFRDIVIVNFFSDLAEEHQKAWRELLRDRGEISDISPDFPQLEGHLKLLYTGITRCSRRLFFLETKTSVAGRAFFRWLTKTKRLAESQDASCMSTAMTPDEWRSTGVDWAINAEDSEDNPAQALEWLDQAIYSFEQVGDEDLLKKARAHRSSLVLRVELEEGYDDFEVTEEKEQELADAAYACAKEGVMPEVYKLIEAIHPMLNEVTQESMEADVLAKIQDFE